MEIEKTPVTHRKELRLNGFTYIFEVEQAKSQQYDECISFKVSKPYDPNHWISYLHIDSLKKEKSTWHNFEDNESLELFIVQSIESEEVELNSCGEHLLITLWFTLEKGKLKTKLIYELLLNHQIGDIAYSLGEISLNLQRVEKKLENLCLGDSDLSDQKKKEEKDFGKILSDVSEKFKEFESVYLSKLAEKDEKIRSLEVAFDAKIEELRKQIADNIGGRINFGVNLQPTLIPKNMNIMPNNTNIEKNSAKNTTPLKTNENVKSESGSFSFGEKRIPQNLYYGLCSQNCAEIKNIYPQTNNLFSNCAPITSSSNIPITGKNPTEVVSINNNFTGIPSDPNSRINELSCSKK